MTVFVSSIIFFYFFSTYCLHISHAPSYLLVAPSTVRPGVPTSVSVTVLGSSSLHVSANISNGGNVLSSGVVIVEGGKYSLGSEYVPCWPAEGAVCISCFFLPVKKTFI